MDKLQVILNVEQYIKKDILYGYVNGQLFKDLIEANCEELVRDNDSVEGLKEIIISQVEEFEDYNLFTKASDKVSDNDSVEEFISSLPYAGEVKISADNSINIADEIRAYANQKNEDNTYGPSHMTLKKLYKRLMDNYIPPTMREKQEEVASCMASLKLLHDDFEDIINITINGISFIDMVKELPTKMDDTFKVEGIDINEYLESKYHQYSRVKYDVVVKPTLQDKEFKVKDIANDLKNSNEDYDEISKTSIRGITFLDILKELPSKLDDDYKIDGIEVDEYILNKYNQYKLVRYNSVYSKPAIVSTIDLTNDAKGVKPAYGFVSQEEAESIVNSTKEVDARVSIHQTIINIINGIRLAQTSKTLHAYDERIALVRDSIQSTFKDDEFIKELYMELASRYAKKENQLDLFKSKWDDFELLFSNDLVELKERLNELVMKYNHTGSNDLDEEKREIVANYYDTKQSIEQMGQSFRNELDEISKGIEKFNIVYNHSRDNVKHSEERLINDVKYYEMVRDQLERINPSSSKEQAVIDVKIDKINKDIKNILDAGLVNHIITQDYYDEHIPMVNENNRQKAA